MADVTMDAAAALRSPELAEALDSDRRFFARWPGRTLRLRRAYPAERPLFGSGRPPPGTAHYITVERLGPGIRLRLGLVLQAGIDTDDVSEDAVRALLGRMKKGAAEQAAPPIKRGKSDGNT